MNTADEPGWGGFARDREKRYSRDGLKGYHSTGRNKPATEVTIQMKIAMISARNQPMV
jgi:hypothetical protein